MSIDSGDNLFGNSNVNGMTVTSMDSAANAAEAVQEGIANAASATQAALANATEAVQAGIANAAEAVQAGIANAAEAVQAGIANAANATQAALANAAKPLQGMEGDVTVGGRVLPSYSPEPYSPKPYTPPAYNPSPYTPEPYEPGTIKPATLNPLVPPVSPEQPVTAMPVQRMVVVKPAEEKHVTDLGMFAEKGLLSSEIKEADQRETTLKGAINALALPEVSVGEPYRQLLCLFTPANHFKEKFAIQSVVADAPEFKVTLESEKGLVLVEGVAAKAGGVKLMFKYKTLEQGKYSWGRNMVNELEKMIVVKPDMASQKEQGLRSSLATYLPLNGQSAKVGEEFSVNIDFSSFFDEDYSRYLSIESASLENGDGLSAVFEGSNLVIKGVPGNEGEVILSLRYKLHTRRNGSEYKEYRGKLMDVYPDPILQQESEFKKQLHSVAVKKVVAGEQPIAPVVLSLPFLTAFPRITVMGFTMDDSAGGLAAEFLPQQCTVKITGVATTAKENPKVARTVEAVCHYKLEKASGETVELEEHLPVLFVNPNPRDLWNDLPTDDDAPYQSPNKAHECLNFGKTLVAASKRGRSHAHDGKFRDDNYKVEHLAETGWTIVAVSDGAGSAEFSRMGSRIACDTFCELLKARLALKEVDDKLLGMPAEEQEKALKGAVLKATYEGMVRIDQEAQSKGEPRKKYAATFLGYVLKRIGEEWLIVSIGIGDGIISLVDKEGNLKLLSEPDGGEFVGQTRFITMNEVWQDNPAKRLFVARVPDFQFIMSMTDGVSDPKFETDNNLKNQSIWEALWDELSKTLPLQERSDVTAQALEDWLDFWAKGNHDDRTIVVVY